MRVALWSTSYFKGYGGAERVVTDLLNAFVGSGIKCFLIADRGSGTDSHSEDLDPRVTVHQGTFPNPLLSVRRPLRFVWESLLYLKASIGLAGFFRRIRPDVVHLQLVNVDVLVLAFYRRLFRYRLIITFTGLELELAEAGFLSRLKMRIALRAADGVTAVSEDICERLRGLFRCTHVRCVHNGIAVGATQQAASRAAGHLGGIEGDQFVFCGGLRDVKRVPFLVEAFGESVRRGCARKLYIIGDGVAREEVLERVIKNGLGDSVVLLGSLPHDRALGVIGKSRCLLLTSSSEGCPVVVLEAMALGKTVIASAVGGLEELIRDGQDGYLFPAADKERLCDLILRIAEDADEARRIGRRAAETVVEAFEFERMVHSYLELYRQEERS